MVLSRKHVPNRPLLPRIRESRWTPAIESEHHRGFSVLDHDVGYIVWMDSRDILDKREGLCVWDCVCVVENVGFVS